MIFIYIYNYIYIYFYIVIHVIQSESIVISYKKPLGTPSKLTKKHIHIQNFTNHGDALRTNRLQALGGRFS